MNFEGYQPQALPRIGSVVQSDDVTLLPLGIATDVENGAYTAQGFGMRDGIGVKLTFGKGNPVGSLGVLRYLAPDNSGEENIVLVACTKDGNVSSASPFVQSTVKTLTDAAFVKNTGIQPIPNLSPQCEQAYNKMLIAQGDLMVGVAPALIVDGATLTCDPISELPVGETWAPQTFYRTGQIVSPTSTTATMMYQCAGSGLSGIVEPPWPTNEGGLVRDGLTANYAVWRQLTILCTSGLEPPPAPVYNGHSVGNAIPPGQVLFLVCTWVNQFGESTALVVNETGGITQTGTLGNVEPFTNTSLAACDISVILPPVPTDILSLAAQYAVTSVRLYGYLSPALTNPLFYLDPTSYAYIGEGQPGAAFEVTAPPTGVQLPQVNNAFTTDEGNVVAGTRYMIVLFESRTGYICGFDGPAPVRCDITVDGRKMLVQNIPIGPYNCIARICAFTESGQGTAGPYFYISADDYEDPGFGDAPVLQTATKIPDNVTTAAYFDFSDSYLPGASNVTTNFDQIQVPPSSDIYFSKTLNRVAYAGCKGYPSGLLISDLENPECVRVPGSIVQVSQTDGDRVVCMRESGVLQVAYKENSAHSITPSSGDPSDWSVDEIWRGSGPCGPRAIDVATADGERLTAFAHKTGGYIWQGGSAPTLVTTELQGTPEFPGMWDRINWAYSYLIAVTINLKKRLVYFYVPIDGAVTNNMRITMDFFYGLDDPIIFIQRTGREVPNISGSKWSFDSIAANDCKYVPQRTSLSQ